MAKHIFEHLWANRGIEVETALEIVRECYKSDREDREKEIKDLNNKISKYKSRKDKFVEMYADGLIDKDTLKEKSQECDENIKMYEERIAGLKEHEDSTINGIDGLIENIRNTMKETLDFSKGTIDRDVITRMVDIVYYEKNSHYKWFLNLNNPDSASDIRRLSAQDSTGEDCGIPLEHQIRIQKRSAFRPCILVKDKRKLVYSTVLTYEQASAYRKANGSFMRPNAWDDLHIEVYV